MLGQQIVIPYGRGASRDFLLREFAQQLKELQTTIDFKVSSRGWCYMLENLGAITKAQFNRVQSIINECRKRGYLPVRFVAEEEARSFSCVEEPDAEQDRPADYIRRWVRALTNCHRNIDILFWKGQEYFIQLLVEKIDLKTLFQPICEQYHIPIATSKGWSSILQRAEIMERFSLAEAHGMKPILLYCGDLDPVGEQISDLLMKNLAELSDAVGWRPDNLVIDRFGLNLDFVKQAGLSWIDNLETGSGKDLGSPHHPDHYKPFVQEYIKRVGRRKCEANALVIKPDMGRDLCRQAVVKYLGVDALDRFKRREDFIRSRVKTALLDAGIMKSMGEADKLLRKLDEADETDYDDEVGSDD